MLFSNEFIFKYLLAEEQLLLPFEYLYDICPEEFVYIIMKQENLSLDTERGKECYPVLLQIIILMFLLL